MAISSDWTRTNGRQTQSSRESAPRQYGGPLNQESQMQRDLNTQTVAVRAIDVGYFQTKLTLGRERSAKASILTDSFPSLAPQADPLQGASFMAAHKGKILSVGDLAFFVGHDAKYFASASEPRTISEGYSETAAYKALTYGALDQMASKAGAYELIIEHLVVGLPCSTIGRYAEPLKAWLQGEPHLIGASGADAGGVRHRVLVRRAHVVPQPLGTLFDYGIERGNKVDGWALVVDPGGGTLDWFCVSKQKANWKRSGAYPKAMLTCAYAVADSISKTLRDNVEVIERIDDAIRRRVAGAEGTFKVEGETHDIASHWERVEAVLHEAVDKMMASVGGTADLDVVLVTGGGAGVFADFMRKRYPVLAKRIQPLENPVFANVRGFHAIGEDLHAAAAGGK